MSSSERDNSRLSDTEGGEKPVREQLKKAHITSDPTALNQEAPKVEVLTTHGASNGDNTADGSEQRGRLHRKRSHEEIDTDSQDIVHEPSKNHTRKRSRDSTVEEDHLNNGQRKVSGERARDGDDVAAATMDLEAANGIAKPPRSTTPELSGEKGSDVTIEAMASPKTKRSRLHSTTAEATALVPDSKELAGAAHATQTENVAQKSISDADTASASSTAKESEAKINPTSGFANTSVVSPFGTIASAKSPSTEANVSSSAFAASGFSALSGTSSSGFGAIGKQSGGFGSGGSFASGTKNSTENDKSKSPPPSSFGGALGQQSAFSSTGSTGSGFGSAASGFGKVASTAGFGSGLGGGGFSSLGTGSLSSFASSKAAPLGKTVKTSKSFGAPPDDDDIENGGDDDDDAGAKSPLATESEKQDERFYEQEFETGEEDEITEFSARAKLYNFGSGEDGKKEWRERGLGVLRFNVRKAIPDQNVKPKARLLMRADGSHRVVLNTPVTKEIKFGAPAGGPPQGGYIYFMGTIDGKEGLELLQMKVKQVNALELYHHITRVQEEM